MVRAQTAQAMHMRYGLLFLVGGSLYVALEYFWRGFSHVSMFVLGGIAMTLLAGIYTRFDALPLALLSLMGAVLITALEFIAGAIVNGLMGLRVWDYSDRKCNLYGQVCASYSMLWYLLSAAAYPVIRVVNEI